MLNSEIKKLNDESDLRSEADSVWAAEWNFSPEKGNVIFCCALDCWGFTVGKFATIWSKKLGVNRRVLQKYMFEDYSFNNNTKKIVAAGGGKPMFAAMILDPIFALYTTCMIDKDPVKAAKMALRGVSLAL